MNIIKKLSKYNKNIFYNGIIFLLPMLITLALLNLCFSLIQSWLKPIKDLNLPIISNIPYYEFVLMFFLIIGIGSLLKIFMLKQIIKSFEKLFQKVPLISIIYVGIKQILHAFSSQDQSSFNTIVIIEFPVEGAYSFGFLTSDVPHQYSPNSDKKYVNVYIPTTPNPTSGFFVMVPQGAYIETDLTKQEAIALVISGGILQPERYRKKKPNLETKE